jgi:hypothetical protein
MRTKLCCKCLIATMSLGVSLVSVFPAFAQQPQTAAQNHARLQEIVRKYSDSGPANLSARDLVDLYDLEGRRGADRGGVFFDSLVWSWAADRGMVAPQCVAELVKAFVAKHGSAPDGFAKQMAAQLVDLPAVGQGTPYVPTYLPPEMSLVRRRVYGLAPLPFGPIEKNALSRLSITEDIRRFLAETD